MVNERYHRGLYTNKIDLKDTIVVSTQIKLIWKIPSWYLYTENLTFRYRKVSMEKKLLSGIPFFEKNGIWRSNFSFVGDSSLFHTLKIRKCVTLDINFLPIVPNILSLNVSITFCLSFGVLIHKICGSSSFLIFFNPYIRTSRLWPYNNSVNTQSLDRKSVV